MKNSLIFIVLLLAILIVFFILNSKKEVFQDPHSLFYEGDTRHFRADLFEANKTAVYPDEKAIKDIILNPEVYKIYIAFIPEEKENSFYLASTFEITNKLGLVYRHYYKSQPSVYKEEDGSSCLLFYEDKQLRCFKSVPINSTDELVPTSVEPVILLLGPSQANKTAVTVNNNLITLEGKNLTEVERNYNDLDLAVGKMLLVLMNS